MSQDVNRLIDEGRWSNYQKLLVAGTALTIILDGIDNTLLSPAIPTLMNEWKLQRGDFATALAMSPFGMLIGGALGGWLGDRIGRRTSLLWSVLVFAIFTMLIYFAHDVRTLSLLRFLAGIGLGGAMPSATALASEYVPKRQRPFAVTLTIVCVPIGAMTAAFLSVPLIKNHGWQTYFLLGGIVPFVIGMLLYALLPESPRFLAGRRHRWPELIKMLHRMGQPLPADAQFAPASEGVSQGPAHAGNGAVLDYAAPAKPRASAIDIFKPGLLRDTIGLFIGFFSCMLVVYLGLLLLPTALNKVAGFPQPVAQSALGWWNIGGIGGALLAAMIIQRLGSKWTMLGLTTIAIVTSFVVASMHISPDAPATAPAPLAVATAPATAPAPPSIDLTSRSGIALILICFVMGGAINAIQVALYALAAHVFPTEIRGTGVGITITVGRIGNILASYVGNYALDHGISAFFATFGIGMILVFFAMLVVRKHIDRIGLRVSSPVPAAVTPVITKR